MGLQCKLFQSLDRRETIIVFRLNGHQTKFVCEVLVLGIRKKSIRILWKERILKYSNQRNKMALEFIPNYFGITLKFFQNFAAIYSSDKIPSGKLPKKVPYLPSFSFFCVLSLVISTSTIGFFVNKMAVEFFKNSSWEFWSQKQLALTTLSLPINGSFSHFKLIL